MILVIVYVGAVAVLFLFVVMMLDVNFVELREGFQRYAPVGATIGAMLLIELALVVTGWQIAPAATTLRLQPMPPGMSATPRRSAACSTPTTSCCSRSRGWCCWWR